LNKQEVRKPNRCLTPVQIIPGSLGPGPEDPRDSPSGGIPVDRLHDVLWIVVMIIFIRQTQLENRVAMKREMTQLT